MLFYVYDVKNSLLRMIKMNKDTESKNTLANDKLASELGVKTASPEDNSIQDFNFFKENVLSRCIELHVKNTMEDLFKEYLH